MVQNGKLVEASELYHQVGLLPVSRGDREVQEAAQQEAAREREALLPRIPRLTVLVEGAAADQVQVTIDGASLANALIGAARPANPGQHTVVGTLGQQQVVEQVGLAEKERKSVTLRFRPPGAPPAAPPASTAPAPGAAPLPYAPPAGAVPPARAAPLPAAPPASAPPPRYPPASAPATVDQSPAADTTPRGTLQRDIGRAGLAIGGIAVVFGAVTGLMERSVKSDLDDGGCVDAVCPDELTDKVEKYNQLRQMSSIGFIVAAVGIPAGALLYLTAPATEPSGPEVQAFVGMGGAGVAGRF